MAFNPATDIVKVLQNYDAANLAEYTLPSYSFKPDKVYLLILAGDDAADISSATAIGVPTQASITWGTAINTEEIGFGAAAIYASTIASASTETITVTFPGTNNFCEYLLLELSNANATIVQTKGGSWSAISGTITLTNPIGADGMAMLFIAKRGALATNFTTGAGQTDITGTSQVSIYGQQNITSTEVMPVGTPEDGDHMGFAIEVAYQASVLLAITDVNGGATIADGEAGVVITGVSFSASGNIVTISLADDINDGSAIAQVINSENTTTIDIDVVLPSGYSALDPVYFFVTDALSEVSASESVGITPPVTPTLHTMYFTDDGLIGGTAVICESSNFAAGITGVVLRGGVTRELSTLTTAISTLPTATPQVNCAFTNGDPVDLDGDTIKFINDGTGDTRSVTGGVAIPIGEFDGTTC